MVTQVYDIKKKFFQDNQSAINMGGNGKKSCTGNSRQINIRYFFAKDRVERNNMSILYYSTDHMFAYFL